LALGTMLESNWLWPMIFAVSGYISGHIFEKFVLPWLEKLVDHTKRICGDIVFAAIAKYTVLWFSLAGCYAAVAVAPLSESITSVLKTALLVVAALSVTLALARIATDIVTNYARKEEGAFQATSMFKLMINALTVIIGILIILAALHINITPVLAALGVGSIAVALAIQEPLGNFFSGLHIIASSQIRTGDYLKLDSGDEGVVTDISWRSTTMLSPSNNIILVPNKTLASAIVTNYHLREKETSVTVDMGVSYDSDLDLVERVTLEVAREVMREAAGGVPEFEPKLRYKNFGDSSVDFTVILRASEYGEQFPIKHEFIKRLFKRYGQEGIDIPYPIRTVFLKGQEPE
jgi:small-conductance mechanosensitive channel